MATASVRPAPTSRTATRGAGWPPESTAGASSSTVAPAPLPSGRVRFTAVTAGSALQAASFAASPGARLVTGWRRPSAVSRARASPSAIGTPSIEATGSTSASAVSP